MSEKVFEYLKVQIIVCFIFKFIQMVVAIEEAFDCEIPDSKLIMSEMDTVEKIMAVLAEL